MRSRSVRLLSVLAVVLAVGACSAAPPADPAPSEPAGLGLPDRPRDVPVDDVRACDLITDAQRAELGLDGSTPRPYRGAFNELTGSTDACSIRGYQPRAITLDIRLSVDRGIDSFVIAEPPVTPTEISSFPAVLSLPRVSQPDNCAVVVDVADGQLLAVTLADGGRLPPIPLDELCADVPRYAEAVVANLLAR